MSTNISTNINAPLLEYFSNMNPSDIQQIIDQQEALETLSPKVHTMSNAKKRSIKNGKLGKKGGLITA